MEQISYQPKVIAFDVFGTVVDFSGIDRNEIKSYITQIKEPVWKPLELPKSWEHLPAHADAKVGLELLRKNYIVVTCSNGPLGMMTKLSKNAGIQWDAIIPLELNKVYKPNPRAYLTVCEVLSVKPGNVLMVTANKTFGDLEASRKLGMQAVLIRDPSSVYADIIQLAFSLSEL